MLKHHSKKVADKAQALATRHLHIHFDDAELTGTRRAVYLPMQPHCTCSRRAIALCLVCPHYGLREVQGHANMAGQGVLLLQHDMHKSVVQAIAEADMEC